MKNPDAPLRPPSLLAIAYAPAAIRRRLTWLLTLDARLLSVLQRANEPMIAQLRLSWWRDAIRSSSGERPKGEPLLAELNDFEASNSVTDAALNLIDAYEILAIDAESDPQHSARADRILAICGAYADWIEATETERDQIDLLVRWWCDPVGRLPKSLTRKIRPLSILALAEQLDSSAAKSLSFGRGLRLSWHALTGH